MSNETERKRWNKQQTVFRDLLLSFKDHEKAVELFLVQHASLHSTTIHDEKVWSFEDWIFADFLPSHARCIPKGGEHSIAWIIWHLARIEDMVANILIAGEPQIFERGGWQTRMKLLEKSSGNALTRDKVLSMSKTIDLEALRAYRADVGRRTQEIIKSLAPEDLSRKVDPIRLASVLEVGALLETAGEIAAYWAKKDFAGLILMPLTRHNFLHLNEALSIKKRVLRE